MYTKILIKIVRVSIVITLFLITGCQQIHRETVQSSIRAETPASPKIDNASYAQVTDADWIKRIQKNLLKEEYYITQQNRNNHDNNTFVYQAPNRKQDLRTFFSLEGIQIFSRTAKNDHWSIGFKLEGIGREGNLSIYKPDTNPITTGPRIEYHRGPIIEWYVNRPDGIEQGFTIKRKIEGSGEFQLHLVVQGNTTPKISSDGKTINFIDADDAHILQYSGLHVFDNNGSILPSSFELAGNRLIIEVDDTAAIYPIIIDPLLSTPTNMEGNQRNAHFGTAVKTAGDVNNDGFGDIIVGAPDYDNGTNSTQHDNLTNGKVFVFHGSATGIDTTPDWSVMCNQDQARFGYSVGTAGDLNNDGYSDIVIGAPNYTNSQTEEGAIFVFFGSETGLSAATTQADADWQVEGGQENALFGYSVSTAGDTDNDGYSDIIVGAPYFDEPENDEGKIFVYYGTVDGVDPTPWEHDMWTAADAHMGFSVSTAGDVDGDGYSDIIVGVPGYTIGQTNEGIALVFYGSGSGVTSTYYFFQSDCTNAKMGYSVDTAGDVDGDGYSDVIIGVPNYYCEGYGGKAVVYYGGASGIGTAGFWTLNAPGSGANTMFLGSTVGTAGDINGDGFADVIIGGHGNPTDAGFYSHEATAYIYHGSSGGLEASPTIASADWSTELSFPDEYLTLDPITVSVFTAGDTNGDGFSDIIIGDPFYNDGATPAEGSVEIYYGTGSGLEIEQNSFAIEQFGSYFGEFSGSAGDLNGDGYEEVFVCAPSYDNPDNAEGKVFIYNGPETVGSSADWSAEGNIATLNMGKSAAGAGDVNGDGYDDFIIADASNQAYVFYGSTSGLGANGTPGNYDWMASGFGVEITVRSAGDVNGDGYSDVVIGAPLASNGELEEGVLYVYYGSDSGLGANGTPGNADWHAEGNEANLKFGWNSTSAGDVNGDGYGDIIVGTGGYVPENAYVYFGSPTGLNINGTRISGNPSNADWSGSETDTFYGHAVGTAGDVNNDGYSDIIVGAHGYPFNGYDYHERQGRVRVYYGSVQGPSINPDWTAVGGSYGDYFGFSIGSGGDVNRDGYGDIVVGAPSVDQGDGQAYVFFGSQNGLNPGCSGNICGPGDADWSSGTENTLGRSVGSGDLNGDGYSDIIIGDRRGYAVFVFHGNNGMGRGTALNQHQSVGANPIARLGISDQEGQIALSALGTTPYGRGKVKLEWEAKPVNQAFNGLDTRFSNTWNDTGTSGYVFAETADGLFGHTSYHWRARLLYPASNPMGLKATPWSKPFPGNPDGIDFRTSNNPPTGGFTSDNVIPAAQIIQSTSQNGIVTINFRIKDGGINLCSLHNFKYSVNNGSTWNTPANNDLSTSLGGSWPDNDGALYNSETDWTGTIHSFTFNTKDNDVSGFIGNDQSDVRVQFTVNDGLENSTVVSSDAFRVDCIAPSEGTISISDNSGTISDATPELILSSSGASHMRFALSEGGLSAASWVPYSPSYDSFNIGLGGNGSKTIWVEFRDQYWNIQPTHASDTTIYDTAPIVTGDAISNNTTPTWSWSSAGDGTGLFRYQLDDDDNNLDTGATPTASTSHTPSLDLSDGEHTLDIQEENIAGYWGATASLTIDIDSGAPCSTASSPAAIDDQNTTFTIDYTSDDIYFGETCGSASSGTGLASIDLYVQAPGEGSFSLVDTDAGGTIDGMFEYTATDEGAYRFYTLATDNAGNIEVLPVSGYDSETVYASEFAGYAILSVGSISDEEGLESHTLTANNVYKHLINRHFALVDNPLSQWEDPLDHIKYFNPYDELQTGEDDYSEGGSISYWTAMQKAITQWALDKMTLLPGPLYLVLIDHGTPDQFNLTGTQFLTAQDLDTWLDILETGMAQNGIAPQNIVIVLGTCYSGSMIDDLSGPNRIIVTSTADDEPSYRGGLEPGGVRDGEFFVSTLFNNLASGLDLKTSFQQASQLTGLHTESGLTNSPAPYFDTALQHPHLDDDGDFTGSHDLSNESDGMLAENIFLGVGTQAPDPVVITSAGVSPDAPVPSDEHTALLWAKVSDIGQAETVWVEVRDPDTELAGGTEQQTVDLWVAELTLNNDQYEATYDNFWDAGQYTLFFYLKDVDGIVSPFYVAYAHKAMDGNTAPGTFNLLGPADGHATTTSVGLGATWETSVDPDGDSITYTLEIRRDPADSRWGAETFLYRQQGLTQNFAIINEEADFLDLRSYLWKVVAVDQYGLETASNQEWGFDIDNNNPLAGWIKGLVYDTATNNPIAHAQITASGLAISLTGTGYYLGLGPAGTFNFTISATGYDTTDFQEIGVPEGGTVHYDFGLSPASGDTEPVATITSPDSAVTINAGDSIYFEGSVIGGNMPLSFAWDFDDGAANVSVKDPESVTFPSTGTYTVTFTVTDDDDDTDSDFVVVTVEEEGSVDPIIPELISPGDNQTQVPLTPQLQAGLFAGTGLSGTHARTLWQISSSNNFNGVLVLDLDSQANLTNLPLPELMLNPDTTYFWRVNFINNTGQESGWSTPFAFTTTANAPDGNDDGVPDDQEVADGVDLDHDGTNDNVQFGMLSVQTAVGDGQIGIKDTADATVIKLSAIDPASITDPFNRPSDLPLGLVSFKISVAQDATVAFPVLLSAPAPADARWYKYDTVNGWLDYTSKTVFSVDRMTVTLTLTDGGDGDGDFTANGIIIDPSGLAKTAIVQPPPQGDETSEGGGGGGGGCFIQTAESNELAFWVMLGLVVSLSLMIAMFFHGRSQS